MLNPETTRHDDLRCGTGPWRPAPLIGYVPAHKRLLAAYGYGGNGITFSYLASRMIGMLIRGEERPWFKAFAIDRGPVGKITSC